MNENPSRTSKIQSFVKANPLAYVTLVVLLLIAASHISHPNSDAAPKIGNPVSVTHNRIADLSACIDLKAYAHPLTTCIYLQNHSEAGFFHAFYENQ